MQVCVIVGLIGRGTSTRDLQVASFFRTAGRCAPSGVCLARPVSLCDWIVLIYCAHSLPALFANSLIWCGYLGAPLPAVRLCTRVFCPSHSAELSVNPFQRTVHTLFRQTEHPNLL